LATLGNCNETKTVWHCLHVRLFTATSFDPRGAHENSSSVVNLSAAFVDDCAAAASDIRLSALCCCQELQTGRQHYIQAVQGLLLHYLDD